MPNTIHCHNHGECQETFVCSHLTEGSAGLGFNCDEPTEEDPFPDAFCDDCELILEAHQGWTEESEQLIEIRLLCSGCYKLSRIRNTHTDVSFEDLSSLRWKCGSCEEWHHGPCFDFSFNSPVYWTSENDDANQIEFFDSGSKGLPTTYLDEDLCVIDGEHYYVRGIIYLPIIGTAETLRWGVWGSLSRENFEKLLSMFDDPKCVELPPMFSWLSCQIDGYPETCNLKMYAHIQEPGTRPTFELEPTGPSAITGIPSRYRARTCQRNYEELARYACNVAMNTIASAITGFHFRRIDVTTLSPSKSGRLFNLPQNH